MTVPDGFARIILICHGAAHLRGETPAIAEALVLRVQHAIRVIASTSLGYLKVIARSSKPEVAAVGKGRGSGLSSTHPNLPRAALAFVFLAMLEQAVPPALNVQA